MHTCAIDSVSLIATPRQAHTAALRQHGSLILTPAVSTVPTAQARKHHHCLKHGKDAFPAHVSLAIGHSILPGYTTKQQIRKGMTDPTKRRLLRAWKPVLQRKIPRGLHIGDIISPSIHLGTEPIVYTVVQLSAQISFPPIPPPPKRDSF